MFSFLQGVPCKEENVFVFLHINIYFWTILKLGYFPIFTMETLVVIGVYIIFISWEIGMPVSYLLK